MVAECGCPGGNEETGLEALGGQRLANPRAKLLCLGDESFNKKKKKHHWYLYVGLMSCNRVFCLF